MIDVEMTRQLGIFFQKTVRVFFVFELSGEEERFPIERQYGKIAVNFADFLTAFLDQI